MTIPGRAGLWVVVLLVLCAGSAWGGSISGTVNNSTGKNGRIYLTVNYPSGGSTGLGTSIATPGSFTINGVQSSGQYTVEAFVDTVGTGIRHANDPVGLSGVISAGTTGNVSAGEINLTIPASSAPRAPQLMVYPGNGANFVMWDGPSDDNGHPLADKYTVYWNTTQTRNPNQKKDVWSGDKDFFAHLGASSSLFYQVEASGAGTSASSDWVQAAPPSGTGSVSGRIFFTGVTPTGPLFVALANESVSPPEIHVAAVASPVNGGSYSVSNLPAGSYSIYPILDLNNSGSYDIGDVGPADSDDFNPKVTVAAGAVTAPDVTLVGGNASTRLTTSHGRYQVDGQAYEWYNLQLSAQSMRQQVVKAQVGSGPGVTGPIDLGLEGNQFRTWINVESPTAGDGYPVTLTYADGSTELVTKTVSGVLNSFATPTAPVGYIGYDQNNPPTFSWNAPSPAPAQYLYSIWMYEESATGGGVWDVWGIPSSQTSIPYGSAGDLNQQTLTDGATYRWSITVTDQNGNQSQNQTSFTTTSAPAVTGFTPIGGLPGTSVTISGINFSPTAGLNTVTFNGIQAAVTQASSSSLRVTVPAGASTGLIAVTSGGKTGVSESQFTVASPISVRGVIRTKTELPVAGARVELTDNPNVFTSTGADGSYTLQPLFAGQDIGLKITGAGYVPTYSARFFLEESLDLTPYPNHLYSAADLSFWGIATGKGVLIGLVLNRGSTPFSAVAGAQVSAMSSMNFGAPVAVSYFDGTSFTGSATFGNGLFFVPNVSHLDHIGVIASKSGWNFDYSNFQVWGGSVTEVGVLGSTAPPFFGGFSPPGGKAGSSVVISGSNFSPVAAENSVRFNGVSASVTSASTTTLTVTVPAGATTGPISVTTPGGSVSSPGSFTMRHTLTAAMSGSGSGTVTSVPGAISCIGSGGAGCSAEFDQGTQVELVATASAGSRLAYWSGSCSGSGPCVFAMSSDRSVGALFDLLLYLKNGSSYYALLQSAFDSAASGDTIEAQAQLFTDAGLLFNRQNAQVKLKGGYDPSFLNNIGFTTLDGRLNLRQGTLRVEKFRIR